VFFITNTSASLKSKTGAQQARYAYDSLLLKLHGIWLQENKIMSNVDAIREETKKHLGGDIDLGHITPELIEEIKKAKDPKDAKDFKAASWVAEGTQITVSGGNWYFKGQCTEQWYVWGSQLDFTGIGMCSNGRQLFRIWPR
jgi:hypothetical protein